MKRGEIRLVGLTPHQGHEQKGRRPALIVSPETFNRVTKVPVVLPITSTTTTGIVRCDQPRALDLGARGGDRRPFENRIFAILALRESFRLSAGESPFPLDNYLSWMSPVYWTLIPTALQQRHLALCL